jgi:hypothetical protein
LLLSLVFACEAKAGSLTGAISGLTGLAGKGTTHQWGGDEFGEGGGEEDDIPAPAGGSIMGEEEERKVEAPKGPVPLAPISISVSAVIALPLSGFIGAGDGAPTYSEAYGSGTGVLISGGYRILPSFDGRVNIGYCSFSPSTFDTDKGSGPVENELTSLTLAWLSVNPRFYFLADRPPERWFDAKPKEGYQGFAFYAGFQVGLSYIAGVEWPTPIPKWDFWESTISFLFEVNLGVEYRFIANLGLYLEVGLPILGPPTAASLPDPNSEGMNEAGSMTALRLSAGLLLAF